MVPIDSKSSQYVNNSELCLLFPAFFHQGFSLSIPQGALRETLKAVTIKFNFANDEFLDRIDFIHGNNICLQVLIKQLNFSELVEGQLSLQKSHDPF